MVRKKVITTKIEKNSKGTKKASKRISKESLKETTNIAPSKQKSGLKATLSDSDYAPNEDSDDFSLPNLSQQIEQPTTPKSTKNVANTHYNNNKLQINSSPIHISNENVGKQSTTFQSQPYHQSQPSYHGTQVYPIQPFNTQTSYQAGPSFQMQAFQPQTFQSFPIVPHSSQVVAEPVQKKTRAKKAVPTASEETKIEVCAIEYICPNVKHPNNYLHGFSDKYPINEIIGYSDGTIAKEDVSVFESIKPISVFNLIVSYMYQLVTNFEIQIIKNDLLTNAKVTSNHIWRITNSQVS